MTNFTVILSAALLFTFFLFDWVLSAKRHCERRHNVKGLLVQQLSFAHYFIWIGVLGLHGVSHSAIRPAEPVLCSVLRSAVSNTYTPRISSTEMSSLTTSLWAWGRRATLFTSLTLAWPRSTEMLAPTSTSLIARTKTWLALLATLPSTPIWA